MPENDAILEIKNVTKTFGGVVCALDDISLSIRKNEIVGVVGENGAGKSTMMKILAGVFPPDSGKLFYKGREVPFPKNPKEAAKRGVAIVYQEKGVVPCLKVYQFLFLGNEDRYTQAGKMQIRKMREYAGKVLKEFKIDCSIDDYMHDLPLSTQKMIEIARAIVSLRLEHGGGTELVIILDEPTAPLTIEERQDLFKQIIQMKDRVSFIFVSHIMNEVMEFTDRIHVLRDGKVVASYDMKKEKISEEILFKVIVGKESAGTFQRKACDPADGGEVLMEAVNLTRNGAYYDISFCVRKGECLGIFGPAGAGQNEILRTIAGLLSYDKGQLIIHGKKAGPKEPPHVRLHRGVGYFSGETGKELFLNWSIAKNITILNIPKILRKLTRVISFKAEKRMAEGIIKSLRIKAPGANTECYSLSGGNKQKVSVGKWFERNPDLFLMEGPTIGIDVGAREDIYDATLKMKERGISMILVSDDPKEYSYLCDKIIYMKNGRVSDVLSIEEFNEVISI
jgi:ribose transport system ATP-binding protein